MTTGPADQWRTVPRTRTVLLIAHNVTTFTRLLDVAPIFDNDSRVELAITWSGSDPFHHGLDQAVRDLGPMVVPWEQALRANFDLAITASHHGEIREVKSPLIIVSHGIGYTKYEPGAGSREPGTGNREPLDFLRNGCSAMACHSLVR